jgi:hypothetical protein
MTTPHTVPLLPAGTRLIHIGHPKSGSTALQVAFARERTGLGEHGVVYPGRGHRAAEAGWAVLGIDSPVGRRPPRLRRWNELVREVADAGDSRVCISNEDFARATPEVASRIVEELGGDRAHVVLVARRLDALLPSQWQERVKARLVADYDTDLRSLLAAPTGGRPHRTPWVTDLPGLIGRWTDVVGAERFTLVVADERDRRRLPATFEAMLGLPDRLLAEDPTRTNRGLSLNESEWVRTVNRLAADAGLSADLYHQLVQKGLVRGLTRQAPDAEDLPLPPLPAWATDRVAELDEERVQVVERFGINVVGDPRDLRSRPHDGDEPSARARSVSIEVAARGLHGVLQAVADRDARKAARAAPDVADGPLLSEASRRELVRELRSRLTSSLGRR